MTRLTSLHLAFLLSLLLLAPWLARAEGLAVGDPSTRAMLPGCRDVVAGRGALATPEAAFCAGTVDALLYLGELLPQDYCFAVPLDVPRYRVVEAIVREIEAVYPSVERQHFKGLALEVLHFTWPCRDLAK